MSVDQLIVELLLIALPIVEWGLPILDFCGHTLIHDPQEDLYQGHVLQIR